MLAKALGLSNFVVEGNSTTQVWSMSSEGTVSAP